MSRDGRSTQRAAARGAGAPTRRGAASADGRGQAGLRRGSDGSGCAVAATAQRARDGVAGAWAAAEAWLASAVCHLDLTTAQHLSSPRRDFSYALTTARPPE
jgi:hypothetical protein